jgi:hypothetical protein
LCVVLVLNGAGSAVASVRMLQQHHAPLAVAAGATSDEAPAMPCHDATAPAPVPVHDAGDERHAAAGEAHGASSDCCASSTCTCGCLHHVAAMSAGVMPGYRVLPRAANPASMALGHPEPALPHPIRPPIG